MIVWFEGMMKREESDGEKMRIVTLRSSHI
jgi:hypothetical protein